MKPRTDGNGNNYLAHVECVLGPEESFAKANEEARMLVRLKLADELGAVMYTQEEKGGDSRAKRTVMVASSASRMNVLKEEWKISGDIRTLVLDVIVSVDPSESAALLDRLSGIPELEHKVKSFEAMVGSIRSFGPQWEDAIIPSDWWVGKGIIAMAGLDDVEADLRRRGTAASNYIRISKTQLIDDRVEFGEPVLKNVDGELVYYLPVRWNIKNVFINDGLLWIGQHDRVKYLIPRWYKLMGGSQYSELVRGRMVGDVAGWGGEVSLRVCIGDECQAATIMTRCIFSEHYGCGSGDVKLENVRYVIYDKLQSVQGMPVGYSEYLEFRKVRNVGNGNQQALTYSIQY